MVKYFPQLDNTFSALADPTRRAILGRLSQGEASIMELAEPFDMTLPAVLKHVRVLESAGLLTRSKAGRVNHCRLRPGPLREASAWLAHYRRFWNTKLDMLETFLKAGAAHAEDPDE